MRFFLLFIMLALVGCNDWRKDEKQKYAVDRMNSRVQSLIKDGLPIRGVHFANANMQIMGHLRVKNLKIEQEMVELPGKQLPADKYIYFKIQFEFKSTFLRRVKPSRGQMRISIIFDCSQQKWRTTEIEIMSLDPKYDTSLKETLLAKKVLEYKESKIFDDDEIKRILQDRINEIDEIKREKKLAEEVMNLTHHDDIVVFFTK